MTPEAPGERLRILLLEDEGFVALMVEDMLDILGYDVAASAASVREALHALEGAHFDVAVLDVNVAGEKSFPVAEALLRRAIPFAFATGYGIDGVREDLRGHPVVAKPFEIAALEQAISAALAAGVSR